MRRVYSGSNVQSSSDYIPFAPLDQQNNPDYKYFGIFYTYYWFSPDQQNSNNLDVYFLVNGNIYNHALPKSQFNGINAIIPEPPSTYIAESYKNAYETAFEAEGNVSLNNYSHRQPIIMSNLPSSFINGTFGYWELYNGITVHSLLVNEDDYQSQEYYLFISTGSGGGSGYMYLNWVVVTFGIPYLIKIP